MSVTLLLILITSLFSLAALYYQPKLLEWGLLHPYRAMRNKNWYELFTSGLLHANLGHLLVNMFVLFFFGTELEKAVGPVHLLGLYISGLAASSIPTLFKFKDDPKYATLGASGAVGSVLFAFIMLFPTESLMLILIPIPMPAWFFALAYLGYSVYESRNRRGKVNHEAHIAGALWGIVYMILFVPGSFDQFITLLTGSRFGFGL